MHRKLGADHVAMFGQYGSKTRQKYKESQTKAQGALYWSIHRTVNHYSRHTPTFDIMQ